jgi:hypothetical protein
MEARKMTTDKPGKVMKAANDTAWGVKGLAFKGNKWGEQHFNAWFAPRRGFEAGFCVTLKGLAALADAHFEAYDSDIGEDGVIGAYWFATLKEFMRMRDGEHGRFDNGALGDTARAMALAAGFESSTVAEIP